jgi:hypothetical protein
LGGSTSSLAASASQGRSRSSASGDTTVIVCRFDDHHNNQNGITIRISHGRTLLREPSTSLRVTDYPQGLRGGCPLYTHMASNDMTKAYHGTVETKAQHGTVEINVRNPVQWLPILRQSILPSRHSTMSRPWSH